MESICEYFQYPFDSSICSSSNLFANWKRHAFKFSSQIELYKFTEVYVLTVRNKFYACRFVFGSSPSHICYSIPHGPELMHALQQTDIFRCRFYAFSLLRIFFFLRNSLLRNQLHKFLLH